MSGRRTTRIAYIHGVSDLSLPSSEAWSDVLAETMTLAGHPTPAARDVEQRTVTYVDSFSAALESLSMPERSGDEGDSLQTGMTYGTRSEKIHAFLKTTAQVPPRGGWGGFPDQLVDVTAWMATEWGPRLRAQARRYSRDARLRAAVTASVLDQLPDDGRLVIVAHSLGTVVALDVIPRLPTGVEVALVTLGSPLPLQDYWRHVRFTGSHFPRDRMRSWVNIADTTDPVTAGRGVSGRFPEARDVSVSFGALWRLVANHDASYYLSLPVVGSAVAEAAYDITTPVENTALATIDRLSSHWDLPLLAAAFATQVSRTCSERKHRWRKRFSEARINSVERLLDEANRHLDELPEASRELPSVSDLTSNAARHIGSRWSDEELIPYTIGLLMSSPVRPFELEVSSDHSQVALQQTLNRIRRPHSELSDQEFAKTLARSLEDVSDDLRPGGRRLGPLLLLGGAAVLAVTGVGMAAAVPTGLAGAAALTTTLAALGPGGMVGGMVTLALGASVGSAMIASGATGVMSTSTAERQELLRFIDELKGMTNQQLLASVIGWLACVRTRDRLGFDDKANAARALLSTMLAEVQNEENAHAGVGSAAEEDWGAKRRTLERALSWLDKNYPMPFADVITQAMDRDKGHIAVDVSALPSLRGDDEAPSLR